MKENFYWPVPDLERCFVVETPIEEEPDSIFVAYSMKDKPEERILHCYLSIERAKQILESQEKNKELVDKAFNAAEGEGI